MTQSATITVRVQPGARTTELVGWEAEVLHLRVSAPPVDGRANAALERLLAELAGVPPSAVAVLRGHTSRSKLVTVAGVTREELLRRLGGAHQ